MIASTSRGGTSGDSLSESIAALQQAVSRLLDRFDMQEHGQRQRGRQDAARHDEYPGRYRDNRNEQGQWGDPRDSRLWPADVERTDEDMNALYREGRCYCCAQRGHPWFNTVTTVCHSCNCPLGS
jgi:hypothetical protein